VVTPARVFLLFAGRLGTDGGDRSGNLTAANSIPSCGDGEPDKSKLRPSTSDGVRAVGEELSPGGHEMDDEVGAIRSWACWAPTDAELASKGVMAMAAAALPCPRERSSTGGQLPSEEGGDGQTAVEEQTGSGVPGGVHAARERRLVARGDEERAPTRGIPSSTTGGARGASTCGSCIASSSTGALSSARRRP
jgi:hypothetical protein